MQIYRLNTAEVDTVGDNALALKKIVYRLQSQSASPFLEVRAHIEEAHWPCYREQGFARGVIPHQVYAWPGLYQKTPLLLPYFESIATDTVLLPDSGKRIDVLRFDTLHPLLMGNKWFKLLHNLRQMKARGYQRLLTFGGAYSNHLFATAAVGRLLGIPTQAIVRGEPVSNPILDTARANGMALDFWSRSAYRDFHHDAQSPNAFAQLRERFPDAWIIPEGGGNAEGIKGAQEMWPFFAAGHTRRDVFMACGTGSTLAGLLMGCKRPEDYTLQGVAVLKGGDFLTRDISRWISQEIDTAKTPLPSWRVHTQFHGGGYARCKANLRDFLRAFREHNPELPVEHVYTGKLFWAMDQLLLQDPSLTPESMLALHTGGVYADS